MPKFKSNPAKIEIIKIRESKRLPIVKLHSKSSINRMKLIKVSTLNIKKVIILIECNRVMIKIVSLW